MSNKVHIFVATTKGLVAIQNITLLDDPDIHSLVTIDGSARLAGVSDAYHLLVNSPAGIIAQHFGGQSYRVNVSKSIDQGESWQLGFYLAHLFDSLNQLAEGQPEKGDVVLCVTGAISTYDLSVKAVSQLDLKMQTAKGQIQHWQSQGMLVQWVMPQINLEALNTTLSTTYLGVHHLSQCADALMNKGILRAVPDVLAHSANADGFELVSELSYSQQIANDDELVTTNPPEYPSSQLEQATINADKQKTRKQLRLYILASIIGFFIVGLVTIQVFWQNLGDRNKELALIVNTSPSGICDKDMVEVSHSAQQMSFTTLPKQSLDRLCSLALQTSQDVNSLWLVADSGAVISLKRQSDNWFIPLPKNQRVDRAYTLVMTKRVLDEADMQSFKQHLQSYRADFEKTLNPLATPRITLNEISPWFAARAYSVSYISSELLVKL